MKHGWEKIPNWECLFVHREKGLFLSVYVDDIKLTGKKHNIDPMWKIPNKEVDLGEPTSFLFVCSKAWLALSGASAGGFVSPGSNVGLSTLAFTGVPVLAVLCLLFLTWGYPRWRLQVSFSVR